MEFALSRLASERGGFLAQRGEDVAAIIRGDEGFLGIEYIPENYPSLSVFPLDHDGAISKVELYEDAGWHILKNNF